MASARFGQQPAHLVEVAGHPCARTVHSHGRDDAAVAAADGRCDGAQPDLELVDGAGVAPPRDGGEVVGQVAAAADRAGGEAGQQLVGALASGRSRQP